MALWRDDLRLRGASAALYTRGKLGGVGRRGYDPDMVLALFVYALAHQQRCGLRADVSTQFQSSGLVPGPLGASLQIPGGPGNFVWAGVQYGAGTSLLFARFNSVPAGLFTANQAAATANGAGQTAGSLTAVPSAITTSAGNTCVAITTWMAIG